MTKKSISKKLFWFPTLLKKIFWFWWRKKKSDSEFLSYNLMLYCGKKIHALRDKKINILILVLFEKEILNETKNHNPSPFKLNGRSLILWWNDSLNNYGRYSKCSSAEKLINSIVYRYSKKHFRINNWFYRTDTIFSVRLFPPTTSIIRGLDIFAPFFLDVIQL